MMKLSRRQFLCFVAGAAAFPALGTALAQTTYPVRPVRLIVPWPAGGTGDLYARLIGQWLTERLGQAVIVENRGGAGGNIGTETVAMAAPDGYTLLYCGVPNAWNATLYPNLRFNFVRDIAPVASVSYGFGVLVVHPSFPATSVPELIAAAKAKPGKIDMASGGVGSPQHVWGELFKMTAGVDLLHVPYRGGASALADLLAGQVPLMFDPLATSFEHVKAGKLRALGVTSGTRLEVLPDVPAVAEFVPGYEATGWTGVCAPHNTPAEIIRKLNTEINAGLAEPRIKDLIASWGSKASPRSPADFGKFVSDETDKWAKVITFSGAKVY
jgi:tripartite-type tricarboxylate transporter receptor subunit TctC